MKGIDKVAAENADLATIAGHLNTIVSHLKELGDRYQLTSLTGFAEASKYVTGDQLKDDFSKVRPYFYPSDFSPGVKRWKQDYINTHRVPTRLTWFIDSQGNGVEETFADIDHKVTPVAEHWNEVGNGASQEERAAWYNDLSNLQVLSRPVNQAKGSGGKKFSKIVKPSFRGPGEK